MPLKPSSSTFGAAPSDAEAPRHPFDRKNRLESRRSTLQFSAADLAEAHAANERAVSAPVQDAAATPRRVLVIENDIETADLIIALLESDGYKVEVATDGQYGLMLADSFEPHVILLALSLPGISAYEVTQILRYDMRYSSRCRHQRIFYLTSKDHMLQKRFGSLPDTPMADYIYKPIDLPELPRQSRARLRRIGGFLSFFCRTCDASRVLEATSIRVLETRHWIAPESKTFYNGSR
jgi:DNA-binding response OmpR family regulator